MSGSNGSMKVFRASAEAATPIEFGLEVVRLADGIKQTHKFKTYGRLSMRAIEKVYALMGDEDFSLAVNPGTIAKVGQLLALLLPSAEYDRLQALMDDDTVLLDADLLAEVMMWILEQQTGRPTEPPSSSGDGRPASSVSSTESLSLPGSMSSTSPSSDTSTS